VGNNSAGSFPMHYVSDWAQAGQLIEAHQTFWVCNCGCRESHVHCSQSRKDVCLSFVNEGVSGSGVHEISKIDAFAILEEARQTFLVARPFRNSTDRRITEGICFCCKDCCGYFTAPEQYSCDQGNLIESTRMESCTHCSLCVDKCYFKARAMQQGTLTINRLLCYGCGLCEIICPENCISMISR
jgi:ferredoxin